MNMACWCPSPILNLPSHCAVTSYDPYVTSQIAQRDPSGPQPAGMLPLSSGTTRAQAPCSRGQWWCCLRRQWRGRSREWLRRQFSVSTRQFGPLRRDRLVTNEDILTTGRWGGPLVGLPATLNDAPSGRVAEGSERRRWLLAPPYFPQ